MCCRVSMYYKISICKHTHTQWQHIYLYKYKYICILHIQQIEKRRVWECCRVNATSGGFHRFSQRWNVCRGRWWFIPSHPFSPSPSLSLIAVCYRYILLLKRWHAGEAVPRGFTSTLFTCDSVGTPSSLSRFTLIFPVVTRWL